MEDEMNEKCSTHGGMRTSMKHWHKGDNSEGSEDDIRIDVKRAGWEDMD
jgi:hypothetical protein